MKPLSPLPAGTREIRTLANTFDRLHHAKELTVGYFGGSITEGAGASSPALNWRGRTTAWLRERFPEAEIREINAAIGGTGSDLGAFRCQRDLLGEKPDLVFVEFAVNDFGNTDEMTPRAMEGIVRQIWKANPAADIVFVYTVMSQMEPFYSEGDHPASVKRHHLVAAHYGIPEVNVGYALYQEVVEKHGGEWEPLLPDKVHPNDAAYEIYFGVVSKYLEDQEAVGGEPKVEELAVSLTPVPLEAGQLIDAWELASSGWEKDEESLAGRYPHRLTGRGPDAGELTFSFEGNAVGLYYLTAPDSGILEWSVDGGPWQQRNTWDKYALQFTRASYGLLAAELEQGPHELRLRISAEKDEQSTGHTVCLGAVLVNG